MDDVAELTRDDLRARYGVESEFVRVKELAKIMGVSAATIYSQIRDGAFALPVRRIGEMPLVRVDHLLAWLNEPGDTRVMLTRAPVIGSPADGQQPMGQPVDRMQAAIDKAREAVDRARARRSESPRMRGR
jgi:predicted DNA-binding transcriptional regulator AlpA